MDRYNSHTHSKFAAGFNDTPLTIEFASQDPEHHQQQQQQRRQVPAEERKLSGDSPLTAFLRSSNRREPVVVNNRQQDVLSNTQHTVSTFGTSDSHVRDNDIQDFDDMDSMFDDDIMFDGGLNDVNNEGVLSGDAVDQAFKISCDTVHSFQKSDSYPSLQGSFSSFHEIIDDSEVLLNDEPHPTPPVDITMSALNEAFAKLNACMERTAKSRQLLKQSAKSCDNSVSSSSRLNNEHPRPVGVSSNSGLGPPRGDVLRRQVSNESFRMMSRGALKRHVSNESLRIASRSGLLKRQGSNESVSSVGSFRSCKTSVSKAKLSNYKQRVGLQRGVHRASSNASLKDHPSHLF